MLTAPGNWRSGSFEHPVKTAGNLHALEKVEEIMAVSNSTDGDDVQKVT